MDNKSVWSKIIHIIITVLTAIATTFGVTSCMPHAHPATQCLDDTIYFPTFAPS